MAEVIFERPSAGPIPYTNGKTGFEVEAPRARKVAIVVSKGTLDMANVHPREVVKQALSRNAAAVIVAHNHPSGVAEPSVATKTSSAMPSVMNG